MITKIANRITNYLVEKNIVSRDDIEVYVYGYEAIISSFINIIVIMIIGILFQQSWKIVIFVVVFATTRVYSGGYHASTYVKCNIVLSIVYFGTILLNDALYLAHNNYPIMVYVLFYLSVIIKFAPVPNPRKQTTCTERLKFREKVLRLSVLWTVIIAISYFMYIQLARYMSITLFSIAILIVIEHVIQRKEVLV